MQNAKAIQAGGAIMTRVEIRNNATGEVRDCSDDLVKMSDNQVYTAFVWSSGASCDCHRAMFLGKPESELQRGGCVILLFCCFIVYLAGWFITASGIYGYFRHDFPSPERKRSHAAFACGWALIPITWVMAPFMTGFYEHWRPIFK